tara:strand:+ start:9341 stop:10513 length:1173 start_codon:yes stop_codon:yes gene_type:complete
MKVEISNDGNGGCKSQLLSIAYRFAKNNTNYTVSYKRNFTRRSRINETKSKDDRFTLVKSLPYGRSEIEYKGESFFIVNTPHYPAINIADTATVFKDVYIECDDKLCELIKAFLIECNEIWNKEYNEKHKSTKEKIKVLIWDDYWEDFYTRPPRSLESISLDFKEELLGDIKNFLSIETEQKYRRIGRPYHRNYLLEGIPGTGKTSLIYALASELNMSVALINFTVELNDTKFMRAIQRLPEDSILVLEDIDHLFIERKKNDDCKNAVTFSGILNALDGFVSQDKLITFLTTNHKCHLDNALIRPGRIAKQYHFDYSTKTQIKHMYKLFFPESTNVDDFYAEIKKLKITTAILQNFLFQFIDSDNILDHVDELKKMVSENKYEDRKDLYT